MSGPRAGGVAKAPDGTPGEAEGLGPVSRRSLFDRALAALGVLRLRPGPSARSDDVLAHARAWLMAQAEIDRLSRAWQDEESRLARDFRWFELSAPERRSHPEAREIHALDERITVLFGRCEDLLETLERLAARDVHDVAAKLVVAVRAMQGEDATGFDLLAGAVRELAGQRCPACGAALLPPGLSAGTTKA